MKTTDVVIAGAGPAGSVCGCLLQRARVSCILIDRAAFPRDKICGGGLTPRAWHLLEGLLPGLQYDYNAVSRIQLDVNGRRACEFDTAEPIRIVRRQAFDHVLLKAYQSQGGEFLHDALVGIEESGDRIIVTLKSGERIACRYLVGADGSNSRVRRYLQPESTRGTLAIEQYMELRPENTIVLELSSAFQQGGYFFRFPNTDFDVVGYGDYNTTPDKFRRLLQQKGLAVGKFRGAYVYMKNDYPLHDHILLIGDAGGFAQRTTSEGLYDAFLTARNASEAIISGRPFREVNAAEFRQKKKEERLAKLFYSRFSFVLIRLMSRFPRLLKWIIDRKLGHSNS